MIEVSIQTAKWYSLCVIRNDSEFIITWNNDNYKFKGTSKLLPIDGSIVFGRKRIDDDSATYAFLGKLSTLKALISPDELTVEHTKILCSENHKDYQGIALNMNNLRLSVDGYSAVQSDFNPCSQLSQDEIDLTIVWPVPVQYKKALGICKLLNLTLVSILDEAENTKTTEVLELSTEKCLGVLSSRRVGWIMNTIPKDRYEVLRKEDGFNPSEYFLAEGNVSNSEMDLLEEDFDEDHEALLLVSNAEWKIEKQTNLHCPICRGPQFLSVFRLQGLCQDSHKYIFFYPRLSEDRNQLYFHSNIDIMLQFTPTGWVLRKINPNDEELAKMSSRRNPIGRNDWKVFYTVQSCKILDPRFPVQKLQVEGESSLGEGSYRELIFSSCSKDEFVCNDGSCVPKEYRCSRYVECSDGSDELKCDLLNNEVKSMKYYDATVPPNRATLDMTLVATLQKVSELISFLVWLIHSTRA